MSIYKKLPEILQANAYPTLEALELHMATKVEYIRFCFSKDLTEQQLKHVRKDEALLKAIQDHVTTLDNQIRYLLGELEKTRLEALKSNSELIEIREENITFCAMIAKERARVFNIKNEQAA
jgi:hypothetical protein